MNGGEIIEGVADFLASCLTENSNGNENPWPKIIIGLTVLAITIGLVIYFG